MRWALALLLAGCPAAVQRRPDPIVIDRVVTVPVPERCLRRPPPTYTPEPPPTFCEADKPCSTACPLGFICLKLADAIIHAENDEQAWEWIGETWGLCRPPPTTQPATGPTP